MPGYPEEEAAFCSRSGKRLNGDGQICRGADTQAGISGCGAHTLFILSASTKYCAIMVNDVEFGADSPESGAAMASARWFVLLLGVIAILFGVLFFVYPIPTLTVLATVLGIYWLLNGIVVLLSLSGNKTGWGWKMLVGILGILAGVIVLIYPFYSAVLIPTIYAIIIGVEGLVIGAIYLVQGFSGEGWGTAVLGILSIIFGLILVAHPFIAALAFVLLLAGLAVVAGVAAIILALRMPG